MPSVNGSMNTPFKKIVLLLMILFVLLTLPAVSEENPITTIFKQQADSIVLIGVLDKQNNSRSGSGFFIGTEGLIVTNYHLIKDAKKLFVKLKNNSGYRSVRVIGFNASQDIALIKINGKLFRGVKLGDSDRIEIGERVVAIGNPLGLEDTVSDGIVSSVRTLNGGFKLLQVSVPLSNGSSGGPLFNLKGEVIGITTASFSKGQNLNFAIPVNYLKAVLVKYIKIKEVNRLLFKRALEEKLSEKKTKSEPSGEDFIYYIVKASDTLFSLSRRFNTTVEKIMGLNNFKDAKLTSGQRIKIPRKE